MEQDKKNLRYIVCKVCGRKFYVIVPNSKVLTTADGYLMAKSDNMFPLTYTCIYCQHEAEYLESQIISE